MWAPFIASLVTGVSSAGAAALADRFLFSPQAGVDQTEHAERRPVIGLFAHSALDFGTRGGKRFSRCRVVAESARDTSFYKG